MSGLSPQFVKEQPFTSGKIRVYRVPTSKRGTESARRNKPAAKPCSINHATARDVFDGVRSVAKTVSTQD